MKLLKKTILMLGFAVFVAAPVLNFVAPTNTFAAVSNAAD